jgi:hypothetical protein
MVSGWSFLVDEQMTPLDGGRIADFRRADKITTESLPKD